MTNSSKYSRGIERKATPFLYKYSSAGLAACCFGGQGPYQKSWGWVGGARPQHQSIIIIACSFPPLIVLSFPDSVPLPMATGPWKRDWAGTLLLILDLTASYRLVPIICRMLVPDPHKFLNVFPQLKYRPPPTSNTDNKSLNVWPHLKTTAKTRTYMITIVQQSFVIFVSSYPWTFFLNLLWATSLSY